LSPPRFLSYSHTYSWICTQQIPSRQVSWWDYGYSHIFAISSAVWNLSERHLRSENRTAIDSANPTSHSAYRQPAACGFLLRICCDVLTCHPHDLILLCFSYGYSFCKYSQ
jgi:hypothetical protein